jgi:lysophospholipase L1-like esterase
MPGALWSERTKVVLLAVASLAVVVFWGYLLTASPKGESFTPPPGYVAGAASTAASPTAAMRVTVVGGAFTAPTAFGGRGAAGWPELVGSAYGWETTVLANDGAGFLTRGNGQLSLPATRPSIAGSRPDLVLIAGGRADVGQAGPDAIAAAARAFVADVRSDLPRARIVVLGPVATDETPPSGATAVRDALRTAVTSVPNTTFVDPLAENWFANAPLGAIAPDGQHPTDVGHRLIADRLRADLVRLGIAPHA